MQILAMDYREAWMILDSTSKTGHRIVALLGTVFDSMHGGYLLQLYYGEGSLPLCHTIGNLDDGRVAANTHAAQMEASLASCRTN